MDSRDPELVVIDTDGGGDDALAMLLALSDKKVVRVLAITCCFGNTSLDNVCPNVMRVLSLCGEKDIPVHRGCCGPLIKKSERKNLVFGIDGFCDRAHEFSTGGMQESDVPASLALIQLAKKYPKQIHMVAIGPLTNVALAHRIDPDFSNYLKSLVCMGGTYKGIGNATETAEFNFYCDPESAHIVVSELSCPIVLIPWESVLEYGIEWQTYQKLIALQTAKSTFMEAINRLYVERSKKKGNRKYYDGDFLAVATLVDPHCIADSIERAVVVECGGAHTKGQAILLREAAGEVSTRKKLRIVTVFDEDVINKLRFQMLR